MAVSLWFSTCTLISYFPEWLRSALRMKMMLSQSVLRMLTCVGSMAWPSFSQVTFGLGLPCRHHTGFVILLRDAVMKDWLGHCFTINGTTRLTASPTLRVYVIFKCRGTRILGGSEEEIDHKVYDWGFILGLFVVNINVWYYVFPLNLQLLSYSRKVQVLI